jgi:transcriptional regulator with XRE-family HTH domain
MITPMQMRAARAMLSLSQGDVAKSLGIAANTLSNIENGQSDAPASRLKELQDYYVSRGVQFTANGGVEPFTSSVVTYQGYQGFADFRLDILAEAKLAPLDVCVSNVDEREFDKWGAGKVNEEYFAEMQQNKPRRFRILVKEQDNKLSASGYATYRWLPADKFGKISFFVYAQKTAIISFEDDDFQAFIINHPKVSTFYRNEFEGLWSSANDPALGDE